jgi:group I intron endonuclease
MKFIFTNYSNLLFLEIQDFSILYSTFVPIMIYSNADIDKLRIIKDNKGKTGIYQWTHLESGKIYISSALDLSMRLSNYFTPFYLKLANNYISRALILHTYSAFSLTILKYIDISNLSKKEARKLILSREQHFLDLIFSKDEPNTYNILKVAGSLLGFKHSEEIKTLISEVLKGENNPMFGRIGKKNPKFGSTHSESTKTLINNTITGKTHSVKALLSETHKGKSLSVEIIAKISETLKDENNPMFGKTHSAEAKAKISATKGTAIYVYSSDGTLVYNFSSANKAAEYFNCYHKTIIRYVRNQKIFKEQWILSTSLITKE